MILMEEHDHNIFKKSKPLIQSLRTRQYCKSSYTILEGLLDERHGECIKIDINASLSKTRFVSRSKSLTKGGRSTSTNG
jgi:hypothetical protein